MYEDLESRLKAARGAIEPSKRPAARRARSAVLAGAALALVAVVAIVAGGDLFDGESASPPAAVTGSSGSELWPVDTLRDWTSYADQLSVVSVVDERELAPPPGADSAADADYVARELTLRVERSLWEREQGPSTGSTVAIVALGWIDQDGERYPFRMRGGTRLELGERYLVPLVHAQDGWGLFSPRAVLALDGDRVNGKVDIGEPSAAVAELAGTSVERAGEIVRTTEPDPLAVKHAELAPAARWRAADADRQ